MKRLILAVLVIGMVLLAACAAPSAPPAETPAPAPTESAPTAIFVSAYDLHSAYKANEIAADAKYKDKILQVIGVVDSIGKDILGTPYITLTGGGEYEVWGVQCMFDTKYEPELALLTKGQVVTVQGKCDGYLINVLMKDCILVR